MHQHDRAMEASTTMHVLGPKYERSCEQLLRSSGSHAARKNVALPHPAIPAIAGHFRCGAPLQSAENLQAAASSLFGKGYSAAIFPLCLLFPVLLQHDLVSTFPQRRLSARGYRY